MMVMMTMVMMMVMIDSKYICASELALAGLGRKGTKTDDTKKKEKKYIIYQGYQTQVLDDCTDILLVYQPNLLLQYKQSVNSEFNNTSLGGIPRVSRRRTYPHQ